MKKIFEGVYREGGRIYTENMVPGKRVYNEKLMEKDGIEYRSWNPYRSKMAAAILKGMKNFPIKRKSRLLYLGVASGTTASHFSDIVTQGIIYGIEIAFKPMKNFVVLCRERKNMVPVMANADKPEEYEAIVENADVIYQDIAQRNQVEIFVKNMERFDIHEGIIMVKARSIDISMEPKKVFGDVKKKMEERYSMVEGIKLSPYARDHMAIYVKE